MSVTYFIDESNKGDHVCFSRETASDPLFPQILYFLVFFLAKAPFCDPKTQFLHNIIYSKNSHILIFPCDLANKLKYLNFWRSVKICFTKW